MNGTKSLLFPENSHSKDGDVLWKSCETRLFKLNHSTIAGLIGFVYSVPQALTFQYF